MSTTSFYRKKRWRDVSLLRDERGAVAFELPFVFLFVMISLILPLADVAAAGFQYISAWQALRAFGQSIQYSPPADVTNASDWVIAAKNKADSKFPISDFQIICGETGAPCSTTNTVSPKYYSYATTITLAPLVLRSALCSSSCTISLSYSERFQ